jgi:hypothetical protein
MQDNSRSCQEGGHHHGSKLGLSIASCARSYGQPCPYASCCKSTRVSTMQSCPRPARSCRRHENLAWQNQMMCAQVSSQTALPRNFSLPQLPASFQSRCLGQTHDLLVMRDNIHDLDGHVWSNIAEMVVSYLLYWHIYVLLLGSLSIVLLVRCVVPSIFLPSPSSVNLLSSSFVSIVGPESLGLLFIVRFLIT